MLTARSVFSRARQPSAIASATGSPTNSLASLPLWKILKASANSGSDFEKSGLALTFPGKALAIDTSLPFTSGLIR